MSCAQKVRANSQKTSCMVHKVGGKGGEHEINAWEEPLMTLQQLPFCAFQHFPPLTSAKQQKEGATSYTQCCTSGTEGTDSNCSQQPNILGIFFLCLCPKTVFSGNFSSAKRTGSLWLHQAFHCSSTCADTMVEVRREQKEQNSAQGLLLLPHPILL